MNKPLDSTFRAIFFVTIPVLFAISGYYYLLTTGEQLKQGAWVEWITLGKPPSTIDQVWAVDFDQRIITVRTTDGKLYQASSSKCQQVPINCWVEQKSIEQDINVDDYVFPHCSSRYKQTDKLPSTMTHCASWTFSGFDLIREVHFAILEDNSVWHWEFGRGSGGGWVTSYDYFGVLFPCAVLSIGMFLSIIVAVVMLKRIRKNESIGAEAKEI